MKDSWTDYPMSVIAWAMQSLIGRLIVVLLVIFLGCGIGTAVADRSIAGFFTGLLMFPLIALPSFLVSVGLFVLPITLVFTCLFIIHEWPRWSLILPFALNIWLSYDYTDYVLNRSYEARFRKEMAEGLERAERDARERAARKADREGAKQP